MPDVQAKLTVGSAVGELILAMANAIYFKQKIKPELKNRARLDWQFKTVSNVTQALARLKLGSSQLSSEKIPRSNRK